MSKGIDSIAQINAILGYYDLLNKYIVFARPDVYGEYPYAHCYEEHHQWYEYKADLIQRLADAQDAICRAGVELPVSWVEPNDAMPDCKLEITSPPVRGQDGGIIRDGWAKLTRPGVDTSWAARAQREILTMYRQLKAKRDLQASGEGGQLRQQSAALVSPTAEEEQSILSAMRKAIAAMPNGKTTKSNQLIKFAQVKRQAGLMALRTLQGLQEYDGFSRPKAGRYRPVGS